MPTWRILSVRSGVSISGLPDLCFCQYCPCSQPGIHGPASLASRDHPAGALPDYAFIISFSKLLSVSNPSLKSFISQLSTLSAPARSRTPEIMGLGGILGKESLPSPSLRWDKKRSVQGQYCTSAPWWNNDETHSSHDPSSFTQSVSLHLES